METSIRLRCTLLLVVVLVSCVGPVHATTSEILYNKAHKIEAADSGIRTIEIDSSGNTYASFGSSLYKLDSDGVVLFEREFAAEILATSIVPDFSKIAITLRTSSSDFDSVYILSTSDLSTMVSSDSTTSNANILMWSPNGANLYSNGPDQGIIQLNRETLAQEDSFVGNHTNPMLCVDVSKTSNSVLTVDQSGLIVLWSEGNILFEAQIESSISDCRISNSDEYFSVATEEDGLRKWTFTGSELKPLDINGIEQYEFSQTTDHLYAQIMTPSPRILVYDYVNEKIDHEIFMFHQFTDYAIVFDSQGAISGIHTNSNAEHVVVYSQNIIRAGLGESGIDTDGDKIPDSLDNDDDGDGIEDNWDLNCPDIGISCDLLPDENLIRHVDLTINATHMSIKQTFTFNKHDSSIIRDLARLSLDGDVKLVEAEAELFAESICLNMDNNSVYSEISESIIIENRTLQPINLYCAVEDGMILAPISDKTTHIRYSITTDYVYNIPVELDGQVIEVVNHQFPIKGSITQLSEQHPIRASIVGNSIASQLYSPWHVQENKIVFDIETIDSETEEISAQSLINSPVILGSVFVGLCLVGFVGLRLYKTSSKMAYDVNIVEEEDEDTEFETDDYDIDEDEHIVVEKAIAQKEFRRNPYRSESRSVSKRVPVRKKVQNEAQQLLNEASNEVVRKRRARRTQQEPTRTKRRRLDDSNDAQQPTRKRRTVKRRIQTDDDMDETLKRFVSESPDE